MNGADVLIKSVIDHGIKVCFANAGTTELPIVSAMDKTDQIKPILGLFEGVCTGAADGYGRMSGKPAMTLLHLGPGFANGIANLHNARRGRTPVLNIIGEHATWHRSADPPLAMDIEGLSATVSHWTCTNRDPFDLSQNVANAVSVALAGKIATLIVPHDHQVATCNNGITKPLEKIFDPVDEQEVHEAARLLKSRKSCALLMSGKALSTQGLRLAAEIRQLTGCDLIAETFPSRIERGTGLPMVERIPYFPETALEMLSKYECVILAATKEPVTFFGYPGLKSRLLREDQKKAQLGSGDQDILEAMALMVDILRADKKAKVHDRVVMEHSRPILSEGKLTPTLICQTLAAIQPEGAIIVEEGLTTSTDYYGFSAAAPAHTVLHITGGAIGYGMPCATGAALACPDQPVINFQADGSALYTVQALWTQAREKLHVITLICSNRSYNILKMELLRAGVEKPGINARILTDLSSPNIDWIKIAEGFGVPAVSVTTVQSLANALTRGLAETGPFLIEMVM